MTNSARLQFIRSSITMLGLPEAVKAGLLHLAVRAFTYHPAKDKAFDKQHKTDTTGTVAQADLGIADESARRAAVYYVSAPVRFEQHILSHLEIDYPDFDFVDVGCGKGRVLLLAVTFPFRGVRGVEISQELCAIASQNLRIWPSARQRCQQAEVVCMDAMQYPITPANTVFHFYNPFTAEVLRPVLGRISAGFRESKKQVLIVYIWEHLRELFPLFDECGFRRLRHVQTLNPRFQYALFTL